MGKLRRFNTLPDNVVPIRGPRGRSPNRAKGEGEITGGKYKPEEFAPELFQVISLGASSSHRKIPLTKFVKAMIEADGFQARAAVKLGIHYSTLKKYMKEYPKLKILAEDIQEMLLDLTESRLKAQIKSGNLNAITYYLNCKGRHRGWISDPKNAPSDNKVPVFVFKKAESRVVE